jgi:hypothetical protein
VRARFGEQYRYSVEGLLVWIPVPIFDIEVLSCWHGVFLKNLMRLSLVGVDMYIHKLDESNYKVPSLCHLIRTVLQVQDFLFCKIVLGIVSMNSSK